ncbi:MAG: hypothetical protein AAF752_11035, partial [Bacteroidota bacterium]
MFKVLRQLNVAKETVFSHLEDQGFEIPDKGPNAKLTPEMYENVLEAFDEERKAAARHNKRVEEIRKEQADEEGEGAPEEAVAEPVVEEPEPVAEEPEPEPVVEEPEPVAEEPEPEPVVEEPEPVA